MPILKDKLVTIKFILILISIIIFGYVITKSAIDYLLYPFPTPDYSCLLIFKGNIWDALKTVLLPAAPPLPNIFAMYRPVNFNLIPALLKPVLFASPSWVTGISYIIFCSTIISAVLFLISKLQKIKLTITHYLTVALIPVSVPYISILSIDIGLTVWLPIILSLFLLAFIKILPKYAFELLSVIIIVIILQSYEPFYFLLLAFVPILVASGMQKRYIYRLLFIVFVISAYILIFRSLNISTNRAEILMSYSYSNLAYNGLTIFFQSSNFYNIEFLFRKLLRTGWVGFESQSTTFMLCVEIISLFLIMYFLYNGGKFKYIICYAAVSFFAVTFLPLVNRQLPYYYSFVLISKIIILALCIRDLNTIKKQIIYLFLVMCLYIIAINHQKDFVESSWLFSARKTNQTIFNHLKEKGNDISALRENLAPHASWYLMDKNIEYLTKLTKGNRR
jgi:hypothetical protein